MNLPDESATGQLHRGLGRPASSTQISRSSLSFGERLRSTERRPHGRTGEIPVAQGDGRRTRASRIVLQVERRGPCPLRQWPRETRDVDELRRREPERRWCSESRGEMSTPLAGRHCARPRIPDRLASCRTAVWQGARVGAVDPRSRDRRRSRRHGAGAPPTQSRLPGQEGAAPVRGCAARQPRRPRLPARRAGAMSDANPGRALVRRWAP